MYASYATTPARLAQMQAGVHVVLAMPYHIDN